MNEKQRTDRKRSRRRPVLFYFLVIILIVAVGGYLLGKKILTVHVIEVVGTDRYELSKIIMASEIAYGENYLNINGKKAGEKLEKEFPYVEKAEIKYRPFQKVQIDITECVPTYYSMNRGQYALLSAQFKVLEYPIMVTPEKGIALLSGLTIDDPKEGEYALFHEDDAESKKTSLIAVMEALRAEDMTAISEVDITNLYSINLIYDERLIVEFGSHSKAGVKARNLKKLVEDQFPEAEYGRIVLTSLEWADPRVYALALQSLEDYDKIYRKKPDPEKVFAPEEEEQSSSEDDESSGESSTGDAGSGAESTASSTASTGTGT